MTVNAPPKVTSPALRPSQKISEVSESETVPTATPARRGASEIEFARRIKRSPFFHSS